jgi:protein-tyrosine phosphatase
MEGFVDLHSHLLPGVDDGATDVRQAATMAGGLRALGYTCLVTTPHARPGLFDPDDAEVEAALRLLREALGAAGPRILAAGEHFLDDVIWNRIAEGRARPYPNGRAILVEIPSVGPAPARLAEQLFRLHVGGLRPVMAHPERCAAFTSDPSLVERLARSGVAMALDLTSLVGDGGRSARRAAEKLLSLDLYDAACTDMHSPDELPRVEKSIRLLRKLVGDDGLDRLLHAGPARIALEGRSGGSEEEPRTWS